MKLLGVDISVPLNTELEALVVSEVYAHLNEYGVFPNLKELSSRVCIPARTLQRKLFTENNMTYEILTIQIRKQLIFTVINEPYNFKMMSAQVGFRCFSSFQRFIFLHWGMTPSNFRRAACTELINSKS